VTRRFHVSLYKVEPSESVRTRNLLSKDWYTFWFSVLDEMKEGGPKVPLNSKPNSFACRAERLTRAGTGPDGTMVGPSSEAEGERPDAEACEEMTLGESQKFSWLDILDTPLVHFARRDQSICD
jgi:hypothetical protein